MRADRLLSMLLLLHANGRSTAGQLAEQLEVSERTIYRDLDALSTAGVPVYTQPGPNGGVFLDEHYRVSLNGLTSAEVRALFVSGDSGPLADLGLERAVEDTLLKLFAALPSIHRSEVERLRQRFYIDTGWWFQTLPPTPFLPILQQAVWEDRRIEVVYQPVEGEEGARILDPYALVAKANIWYLVGRKPDGDLHSYRVSRFQDVLLMGERFERAADFDLAAYWKETTRTFEEDFRARFPPYPAVLRVHPSVFWLFPGYLEGRYERVREDDRDGWITVRVSFGSFDAARAYVLGLGLQVEVIEPPELLTAVLESARDFVALHSETVR